MDSRKKSLADPYVDKYLDEEERELIEAIESGEFDNGVSLLTPERRKELEQSATRQLEEMNREREKITIRIPKGDLQRLKSKARKEGMPYQTLINSILHKAVG